MRSAVPTLTFAVILPVHVGAGLHGLADLPRQTRRAPQVAAGDPPERQTCGGPHWPRASRSVAGHGSPARGQGLPVLAAGLLLQAGESPEDLSTYG